MIRDFIDEVLRNKYLQFDFDLTEVDFDRFIANKAHIHRELDLLSDSTKKKVKQRVFTMLEQVGLIQKKSRTIIIRPILEGNIIETILDDDPKLLSGFLYSNKEIKDLVQSQNHA